MTSKTCSECDTALSNTAVWCHHCGEPIVDAVNSNAIFKFLKILGTVAVIASAYIWYINHPAGPTLFIGSLFVSILGFLFEHQNFSQASM